VSSWIILDGPRHTSTCCLADERIEAESKLLEYVEARRVAKEDYPDLFMYFVTTTEPGFPIKIGISETPKFRLRGLQTGLPFDVKMLGVFKIPDTIFERRVHRKFKHLKLRGEWFRNAPEILDFLALMLENEKAPPMPTKASAEHIVIPAPLGA